ncbi:MAG: gliding motility-associated C-terminal domain-containing protein [Saprospiraceae bacterium]
MTCNGGNNGAISIAPIGGTGSYTYIWTGPAGYASTQQNISGLLSGAYKVTITDNNGCTIASSNLSVTQPTAINIATGSTTMVNVKCKNGSDGAITIPDATGGTSPYTYTWSGPGGFTAATKNISGLKAGGYTVVVTDSKGCTFTNTVLQISEPASLPSVSAPIVTNVKCFGDADGAIQINVSGGTSGYTYSWKNVATGTPVSTLEDPTGLAAGTYAVTITDANLCTATSTSVQVNAPTVALAVTETHVDAACANSATGSISLNISGGWNNQTVTWNPSLPSIPNPTNVLPNTYEATVTDAGGCVVTKSVTVSSAPAISLGDYTINNVKCHGEANGGIVIDPSGGGTGGVYQVNWSPGGLSGYAISNLAGGNYTPTVTNLTTGCTAVFNAIPVTEPASIQIDSAVTIQTGATNNGKIDITTITGGTPSYQISWSGPGGFTSTQEDIANLAAGAYVLSITDANLCVYTTTIIVPADNPLSITVTSVKNACDNDGCILVNVAANATATPFVFSWGAGTPVVTADHNASICGLAPGVYNITVTDAAGHSSIIPTQNITQLAPAMVGDARVEPFDEAHNGSIILSPLPATAPLTYLWNNGSTASALVSLDSGTYVVTVTHAISGCTSVYSYHLNRQYAPPSPTFAATNPNCANAPTGVINFTFSGANGDGQGGGYTFAWSGPNGFTATTKNISGLAAGTYTVTVTDQTPSTFTYSTTLVATSTLAVTNVSETSLYTGGYQVSGAAACDGKATVAFSGASGTATILWSNGITTASNNTLCGGPYSVTVTDAAGCSSVWSDELTSPAAVDGISTVVAPVSCHGECDGIAQVSATGGVAPYTVRWALPGNQFQQDQLPNTSAFSIVDDLCSGSYSLTITDGNGATKIMSVLVTEPDPIDATFSQNPPTRFNSCDAETIIQALGASNPINYSWSGSNGHSGSEARADGLCAGEIVTFVIVDNNGCSATAQDTIEYPNDGCLLGSPVITPGEKDGKNDQLFITCAETLNNTVEIFNRWGQMVFSVQNYDNNSVVWTGETKNGAALPEGVYFYVMNYTDDQGTQQRIKGYVNLLR